MQIFTPHIRKTRSPIHLMYVNSNWIDAQKTSEGKQEPPMRLEWKPNSPREILRFIKRSSLSL